MKTDLVVAGYVFHNNKVLLINHKKLNLWLPPGGHIDENEVPDDTLKREFKEELNLDIEIINPSRVPIEGNVSRELALPFHTNLHKVGDHFHYCMFYVGRPKNPEQLKLNRDELNGHAWLTKEELQQPHIPVDVRNIGFMAFELMENSQQE